MGRAFDADDAWHLAAGTHRRLWEVLGAHPLDAGTTFRVWAPNASAVSVLSNGNGWTPGADLLDPDPSGVWRGTVAGIGHGDTYKYAVTGADGRTVAKADPVAFAAELPPATASRIWTPGHVWDDDDWMAMRGDVQRWDRPMSTYEVHLGSWRYEPGGYRAIAAQLADYCVDMEFTHVELMPICEHPFYGSWGYQTTGYFAPTARFGDPDAAMALVDALHQAGVGVIVDWVPSHFPTDEHGLGYFDGTHLYEHADPRQGFHPDWTSNVFNYGRAEVRSFLSSSANYWLEVFHADGLRVDAVASMLYLDYSREDGEWIANPHGGNENLEAIGFLQELNRSLYAEHPDIVMVAEESTAWPGVTGPVDGGGLGFGLKWDMGWMHDTLDYLSKDPVHRTHHHDRLTFRTVYASSEHYVLPLSHDEVVHGKGSLLSKMPGDRWQQFANLRMLLGYQWTVPGKKLLFMGGEFGAPGEWNHEEELAWSVLGDADHAGVQGWVRRCNEIYRELPALHRVDRDAAGFRWLVGDDAAQSVFAYVREAPGTGPVPSPEPERLAAADADGTSAAAGDGGAAGHGGAAPVLVVLNATPVVRDGYRVGVPVAGEWHLVANSDDEGYGGSGRTPGAVVATEAVEAHGCAQSLSLELPPLAVVVLTPSVLGAPSAG